jgi:aspartyl aminopeptidase
MLKQAGYRQISEMRPEDWKTCGPNSKFYFTRNQSTLFAVSVGGKYEPGNGLSIVGAHTDSPNIRIKPVSKITKSGFHQVGVETYGGGLWHTWFDRDLSVAGRVIVDNGIGGFESRFVKINRPILYIPNLAIHLNREVNESGFKPNFETHLLPILSTVVQEKLDAKDNDPHHSSLIQLLAKEMSINPEQIRDFELSLYDVNPSAIGGINNEFIFSARLDNLMMSFCSLKALLNSDSTLASDKNIRIAALFDHEEIGSESAQGAASSMMRSVIERMVGEALSKQAIRKSLLVSADMAHALHPNYPEKHESNHRPFFHKGLVIKYNTKQRYATNCVSSFIIKEIAKRHNIPLQEFVVRNDVACGSTIGPILSANTGIRTIDVGIPQLGMHSIREMCGTEDVGHAINILTEFYNEFSILDETLKVD